METTLEGRRKSAAEGPGPAAGAAPLLLLSEHFLPSTGGTIRWFENLCRRYEGGPVAVLARETPGCAEIDPTLPFRMERVPFRSIPFLRPESLLNYLRLRARASRLVREECIAVVVAARAVPEGFVARLLRRRFGVPYVVFAHGEEISVPVAERRRHGTRFAKLLAMRGVYGEASRVVANSSYTEGLLRAFGHDGGNVAVLHPGVDSDRFAPEGKDDRRALGLEGRRVLLTVGTLMERKGQTAVVAAMPAILRRFPEAVYLVVGTGPAEASIREAARARGVEGAVRLIGRVPEERLPALYRSADVFVLANRRLADSDLEGFGIAYLEAAASGLPVVAGLPGGNREAFVEGRTALRANPEDPASVADVVGRLLADPSLARRFGAEGRAFVAESFAWEPLAAAWNRLLSQVREEAGATRSEPDRACGCCGAVRRARTIRLRGRTVRVCPECGFGWVEDAGSVASGSLPFSGEPADFFRSRIRALRAGESFEIAGLPNLRALRWGFLPRRPPGAKSLLTPGSLREALACAGFVGIDVRARGAAWRRLFRRRNPLLDAREGLEAFFRSEGDPPTPPVSIRGTFLGGIADALGLGPELSARARRP